MKHNNVVSCWIPASPNVDSLLISSVKIIKWKNNYLLRTLIPGNQHCNNYESSFMTGFGTRLDRRRGMSPVGVSCVAGLWTTTGVFTCGWQRLTGVWTTAGGLVGSTGTDGLSSTGAAFAGRSSPLLKESGGGTGLPDSMSPRGIMCFTWTTCLWFPGSLTRYVSGPSILVTIPRIHFSLPLRMFLIFKLWEMSGPWTIMMMFFFLLSVMNLGLHG